MTTYLELAMPYCLFTIPLSWDYDDDQRRFIGENFIHDFGLVLAQCLILREFSQVKY